MVIILISAEDAVEARKRINQSPSGLDLSVATEILDALESGDDGALDSALSARELKYLDTEVVKLVTEIKTRLSKVATAGLGDAFDAEEGFC